MSTNLPPIGKVMNWLEASGFAVSYLYEDLVFIESNAFLVRFGESDPQEVQIHINSECDPVKAAELEELLLREAENHEIKTVKGGKFTLSQKNYEEFDLRFIAN